MAIYHCSVKIIGRNSGRSAVAAAAYRAGEDIVNEYDGIQHDFTRKKWIEFTELILPKNAPMEYADRSIVNSLGEPIMSQTMCLHMKTAGPIVRITYPRALKRLSGVLMFSITV